MNLMKTQTRANSVGCPAQVPYPPRAPKDTLTPDGRRLMIQPQTADGKNFSGVGADIVGNWLLSAMDSASAAPGTGWNTGYYHLGKTRAAGSLVRKRSFSLLFGVHACRSRQSRDKHRKTTHTKRVPVPFMQKGDDQPDRQLAGRHKV
jgi:hypothetical protein